MGDDTVGAPRRTGVARGLGHVPWHLVAPVLVYLVLALGGVTQSSLGAPELRADPSHPHGAMLGEARASRSDEFLTATPLALAVTASGQTDDLNPLTAPSALLNVVPSGPMTSLLFPDGAALRLGGWLPDSVLFAARYWLGTLLLFLAAPAWFRALTGSRAIGWFAAVLIFCSPANAWWSLTHATLLGFTLAGAVSLQRTAAAAEQARWARAGGWALLGAALLARTPLYYPPWAVVVVPIVLAATVAGLVAESGHRWRRLLSVAGLGALTLLALAAVMWENRTAIAVTGETVYPGARVLTGAANAFQSIFAATNLAVLADGAEVTASNPPEISSGYTVALLVAVLLLARGVAWRAPAQRWAVITTLALTGFWLAWATVDFGAFGTHLPLINQVPPARAAQIIGHVAVLLLCLVLPAAVRSGTVGFALLAAAVAAGTSAYAGSLLRVQTVPSLSVGAIWVSALGLAAVVFAVTYRPRHAVGYVLAGLLALGLVWQVNPVVVGLGDLRGTAVASELERAGDQARAAGQVWASDYYGVDSLLMATGVPSFSGRQMSGPDRAVWERLDPAGAHEDVWNRGGAYIWFSWSRQRDLVWENPSPDVIHLTGSPCVVAERLPRLHTIVATRDLDLDCLTPQGSFTWSGEMRRVYTVR